MAEEESFSVPVEAVEPTPGGCPVPMYDGTPCGRPTVGAYPALGGTAVCLMHSRNPAKNKKAFEVEIECILERAGEGAADFTSFVFPPGTFHQRAFRARCIFRNAIFAGFCDFSQVEFDEEVDFRRATFEQEADFMKSVFNHPANFREVVFRGRADFMEAEFHGPTGFTLSEFGNEAVFLWSKFMSSALFIDVQFKAAADFSGCSFDETADFRWAKFKKSGEFKHMNFAGESDFSQALFDDLASFEESMFLGKAIFCKCRFRGPADLSSALFSDDVDLSDVEFVKFAHFGKCRFGAGLTLLNATFEEACDLADALFEGEAILAGVRFQKSVYLTRARFTKDAIFVHTIFGQDADFGYTAFARMCDFRAAVFRASVTFHETSFRNDQSERPGPIFSLSRFEKPERALFYRTNLAQGLFHNCDTARVTFSAVDWRLRSNRKRALFDEFVPVNDDTATALRPPPGSHDDRNYTLVAEIYQQLKKNYDERRDYWTAGDFHYGEMELKRLSSPQGNRAFRWLHRNLGLAAWYKYASEYGENYVLPAMWLLLVLLALSLLYPLVGLSRGAGTSGFREGHSTQAATSVPLLEAYSGANVMTTVGVAFFQRDLAYQPSWPWGRLLSWLQLLLTYTLVALFLLALRRQFRR